ncbi:Hypothetical protein R9X50_00224100 [Acrodontium crateriforme]|uniref:DAGKc domain-containing protein n=1 Tax=Acrodontium crateriforme TaxID=150365 RepID=A0AAQ3RAR9_9PEZI|nr:Hypothetical protein R9X50_00224100 [Acrodontium crateriforme]
MANTSMTPDHETTSDPFADPAGSDRMPLEAAAVLTVDRNATLTIGSEALIVLDEGLRHRRDVSNVCGLLPQLSKTTRAIPFFNVLWAELEDFDITIHYAETTSKKSCRPAYIHYTVTDKSLHGHAKTWIEALMDRAYPNKVQRNKRIKVLVNPFGGQGMGPKLWTRQVEPIFAAARCEMNVERTAYRGHGIEIAEKLDIDAFDVVACASGDGLPHEVFNGLSKQSNPRRAFKKVAVAQIPCGTGNAMSLNLNGTDSPSLAAVAIVKGVKSSLDLCAVTQGNQKYFSFLSQAVGIIAESDLGTESLRWMGSFRFTWGILVRLLGQTAYPATVSVLQETDDKRAIKEAFWKATREQHHAEPYEDDDQDTQLPALRYGTVNDPLPGEFQTQDMPNLGNFYVGNMPWMSPDAPFFAVSLPADGRMDMITISGQISRMTALRMLTSLENGNLINFPEVTYRKVLAYRIAPRMRETSGKRRIRAKIGRWLGGAAKQKEGLIAMDGESVPFEPFQVEVMQRLGTVLSRRGGCYEFDGPKGH